MKLRKEYVLLLHDVNALDRVFAGLEQMGGVEAEVERWIILIEKLPGG